MSRSKLVVVFCLLVAGAGLLLTLSRRAEETGATGYAMAETMYMAASQSGEVQYMHVRKGQSIVAGDPLFSLDMRGIDAEIAAKQALLRGYQAKEQMERARLDQSRESRSIAQTEVTKTAQDQARLERIWARKPGAVAQLDLDHARLAAVSARMQLVAASEDVTAGEANIAIALTQQEEVQAGLEQLFRRRKEMAPVSPVAGRVEDIFIRQGEWAQADAAVVSLVPLERVKIRFYVPEALLSRFPVGTAVIASSASANRQYAGTVDYVSPRAEFTPPVIYSLESRHKMVFCIEAAPDAPETLIPGMPLNVRPASEE